MYYFLCFTGTTTLVGLSLLHHRLCRFYFGVGLLPHAKLPTWRTRRHISSGPYPLTYLAWVALPAACTPTSIGLQVIGVPRPLLHNKAVILKDILLHFIISYICKTAKVWVTTIILQGLNKNWLNFM
jgi:hypothetical protein